MTRLSGFGVTSFGVIVIVLTSLTAYYDAQVAKWPTTKAVVVDVTRFTRMERDTNKKRDVAVQYRHVTFSYNINGRDFQGAQDYRAEDPIVVEKGMTFVVHYNPSDPTQMATSIPAAGTVAIVGVMFGGVFIALGVFLFWRARKVETALVSGA